MAVQPVVDELFSMKFPANRETNETQVGGRWNTGQKHRDADFLMSLLHNMQNENREVHQSEQEIIA